MAKRVSLRERRAGDAKGIDSIFQASGAPEEQAPEEKLDNQPQSQSEIAPQVPSAAQSRSANAPKTNTVANSQAQRAKTIPTSGTTSKLPTTLNSSTTAEPAQMSVATDNAHQPGKLAVSKVTLYIRPDQVFAVEAIQLAERQRTGQKPDKSELVQEALDLLIEKYGPL